MKFTPSSMYADDRDRAPYPYTDVLGLTRIAPPSDAPARGRTAASAVKPAGAGPRLTLSDNPAATAEQRSLR